MHKRKLNKLLTFTKFDPSQTDNANSNHADNYACRRFTTKLTINDRCLVRNISIQVDI